MNNNTRWTEKAIAFAGCSFTWGQGLYYYSDLSTVVPVGEYDYQDNLVTEIQKKYVMRNNYSWHVANYFNSVQLNQLRNGGSNSDWINYWGEDILGGPNREHYYYPEEIHLFVVQMTQPHRDNNSQLFPSDMTYLDALNDPNLLPEIMEIHGFKTIQEFTNAHNKMVVGNVKAFLQKLEAHGIPTMLYTWPAENVNHIISDPWLAERFMRITYNGITYDCQYDLMNDNPHLVIKHDKSTFGENCPTDHHPSLECHKIIADNVIQHITTHDLIKERNERELARS